ncbi:MAG: cell wall-active antibiotics response protein [Alistipes sp.]|nr:cell wall-active antibiotics response protein [Alistipes sp.]
MKIMKIVEKEKGGLSAIGLLGMALTAVGGAGLWWSMRALPTVPASGFPWEFALAVGALLPIAAGGWCLSVMVLRRRDPSCRYGGDIHDGSGGAIPFAIMVIVAGALLLGFNSGALPGEWRRVFFSWQMLLLVGAMVEGARGRLMGAAVMLAVGGFFIVRRLARIYPDIEASGAGEAFWPVLLVVGGVLILGSVLFGRRRGGWYENCSHGRKGRGGVFIGGDFSDGGFSGAGRRGEGDGDDGGIGGGGSRASGVIDIGVVFGGTEQVYLDPEFRGGRIGVIFGGVKLDLRRTALPEGETWLVIESAFGGVEIDAPEGWVIEIRNESVFGGFSDKRLPAAIGEGYSDGRKLVIRASNVFGGGEVK